MLLRIFPHEIVFTDFREGGQCAGGKNRAPKKWKQIIGSCLVMVIPKHLHAVSQSVELSHFRVVSFSSRTEFLVRIVFFLASKVLG